jgi:hypothetical protein
MRVGFAHIPGRLPEKQVPSSGRGVDIKTSAGRATSLAIGVNLRRWSVGDHCFAAVPGPTYFGFRYNRRPYSGLWRCGEAGFF